MKLNRTARRANGMTFLEIGVVVAVMCSLSAILYVGARNRKEGSDRAANIMNIRNVQQAVRAHQGMNGLLEGVALPASAIFEDGIKNADGTREGYLKRPVPPVASLTYTYGTTAPAIGTLYLQVSGEDAADYAPSPSTYADW